MLKLIMLLIAILRVLFFGIEDNVEIEDQSAAVVQEQSSDHLTVTGQQGMDEWIEAVLELDEDEDFVMH